MNMPSLGAFCYEDSIIIERLNADLSGSIEARKQLASMYADSEKRLGGALEAIDCLLIGIQGCAIPNAAELALMTEAIKMAKAFVHGNDSSTEHGQNDIVDDPSQPEQEK